jgi:hypothetical protein
LSNPQLLANPYRPPRLKVGERTYCEHHGADVEVAGTTDAPIRWPACAGLTGGLLPILTGDLTRAVRVESAAAVAYWWGVSRSTVTRWRAALGIGRMNQGTLAVWSALAGERLSPEARSAGGRGSVALRRRRSEQ